MMEGRVLFDQPLNSAGHVFAAAHGGFDFTVLIRALGNLHFPTVFQLQDIVFQRGIAFCTGRVNGHSAF
jgi:hypothetical protein